MGDDLCVDQKTARRSIPFVAVIEGRTAFAAEELGAAKMLLAASVFSVFAVLHELLFNTRVL